MGALFYVNRFAVNIEKNVTPLMDLSKPEFNNSNMDDHTTS